MVENTSEILQFDKLIAFAKSYHFLFMATAFVAGVLFRFLIYYNVKRHDWFTWEFEKRVNRFLRQPHNEEPKSFFVLTKSLLESTYYEIFENRDRLKRRKPDTVMSFGDRLFLVKSGCAWLIHDLLKNLRFLKFNIKPDMNKIISNVFVKNPYFNKVLTVFPASSVNNILNILPGLFVIGGIFGTFLGVMKGIPELGALDLNDAGKSKLIMDHFLNDIAGSMAASLIGIFFSVCMTLINTWFSPDQVFDESLDRFDHSLNLIWNFSANNDVPQNLSQFDENKDPKEALAEASVLNELRGRGKRDSENDSKKGQVA